MTKIYTKTGDAGQTGLWGGERVPKAHPRVAAYGEVDELNCALGTALEALGGDKSLAALSETLARIQEELFLIGTLLATPAYKIAELPAPIAKGLPEGAVSQLERHIDEMTSELEPLSAFILPGGGSAGCRLHLARAICRRAERAAVALAQTDRVADGVLVYLNRLSDHLFTAARWANAKTGRKETPWQGLRA